MGLQHLPPYDRNIVGLINKKWVEKLDAELGTNTSQRGVVTLGFFLHRDGKVTHVGVQKTEVTEPLIGYCIYAVTNSAASFGPWPPELQASNTNQARLIKFSFNYQ